MRGNSCTEIHALEFMRGNSCTEIHALDRADRFARSFFTSFYLAASISSAVL